MLAVGLVAAVVVGTLGNQGRPSPRVSLSTGSAWFPSPDAGSVALIDGTTVTRVAVGTGLPCRGQSRDGAGRFGRLCADHSRGRPRQVDGSSLTASPPVVLGQPGDSHLSLASNGQTTWAVERNGTVAQQLDPKTLFPLGAPMAFPGHAARRYWATTAPCGWWTAAWCARSTAARCEPTCSSAASRPTSWSWPRAIPWCSTRTPIAPSNQSRARAGPSGSSCFDVNDPRALLSGSQSGTPKSFRGHPADRHPLDIRSADRRLPRRHPRQPGRR